MSNLKRVDRRERETQESRLALAAAVVMSDESSVKEPARGHFLSLVLGGFLKAVTQVASLLPLRTHGKVQQHSANAHF